MKTKAQQLKITEFPFIIKDKNGNKIYSEDSNGYWIKREFDEKNNQTYYENSTGLSKDSNGYWNYVATKQKLKINKMKTKAQQSNVL